jgi:hypothetical protein
MVQFFFKLDLSRLFAFNLCFLRQKGKNHGKRMVLARN